MQTLLEDIELDIQELKCVIKALATDTNPALRSVAKRNIQQMKMRLDTLQGCLDSAPTELFVEEPVVPITASDILVDAPVALQVNGVSLESVSAVTELAIPSSSILAERIKPAAGLKQAISLNDSFRFTRELFGGDATRMNQAILQLEQATSLEKALEILYAMVGADEEDEALSDFVELLKKVFC